MNGITDLSQYLIGATALTLLPGPNSLYCLSFTKQYGMRRACFAIEGVIIGNLILIVAAVFGVGTLLRHNLFLFRGLQVIGGSFLVWLGVNLLHRACLTWRNRHGSAPPPAPGDVRPFRQTILLTLSNPGAVIFYLSFFIPFVREDAPRPLWSYTVLAFIVLALTALYLLLLAGAGSHLKRLVSRHRTLPVAGLGAAGLLCSSSPSPSNCG